MTSTIRKSAGAGSFSVALQDIRDGFRSFERWSFLARMDIKNRYRRTYLGPFWIVLGTLLLLVALGPIYSKLQGQPLSQTLPYVYIGLVIWLFISGSFVEVCTAVSGHRALVLQGRVSVTGLVLRVVLRNTFVLIHNIVALFVCLTFSGFDYLLSPWAIVGVLLVWVCMLGVGVTFACVSTLVRDLPAFVAAGTQVLFFVSPVAWLTKTETMDLTLYTAFNPIAWMIDSVRSPTIGKEFTQLLELSMFALGSVVVAIVVLRLTRHRLTKWV
jgi:ABC-2 type transport system permease protein